MRTLFIPFLALLTWAHAHWADSPPLRAVSVTELASPPPAPNGLPPALRDYALLAGQAIHASPAAATARKAGAVAGADPTVRAAEGVVTGGDATALVSELAQIRQDLADQPAQALAADLGGASLGAGYYQVSGAATLADNTLLRLTGDTAAVYVIHVAGTLTVGKGAAVQLAADRPGQLYWVVDDDVTVEDGAALPGVVLAAGDIQLLGRHYGATALLAEGNITLTDLDALDGGNVFYAPTQLDGQRIGPCPTPPNPAPCANQVVNGSFEDGTACPFSLGNFGFQSVPGLVCGWSNPDPQRGSPDWFQRCATLADADVPTNRLNTSSTQLQPRTGDGYAGVYSINGNGREYIQQRLTAPLQAGQQYYAEFHVSLAPASLQSVSKLGMAITGTPPVIPATGGQVLSTITPQITNSGALPNGVNPGWTKISGVFTAQGGEEYLTIGNFLPDVVNGSSTFGTGPGIASGAANTTASGAYYYIDDVLILPKVNETYSIEIPCDQTQTQIGANCFGALPGLTYFWSPATGLSQTTDPLVTATPTAPTTYTLTVSLSSQIVQTYTFNVSPARYGYTNLGSPTAPTTLNANGGTTTFTGNRRVRGDLVLTNGTFELAPGCHFWVDTPLLNGEPTGRITVGANATLRLNNATIEAFCENSWQGIYLDVQAPNTRLIVENNSTVANAQYAVLAENPNNFYTQYTYDTYYRLEYSAFRDNLNHVFDESGHHNATTSSVIRNCSFTSTPVSMLPPYDGGGYSTYEALHLQPYNLPDGSVTVDNNSINGAVYGIVSKEPDHSRVPITNNLLQGIQGVGIWLSTNFAEQLYGNAVYLQPVTNPASPQVDPTSTVTGIYSSSNYAGASVSNRNYVYGVRPGSVANLRFQQGQLTDQQVRQCFFFDLDIGIKASDGSIVLGGNRTSNCTEAVRMGPLQYSFNTVDIRCNTFSRAATNSTYSYGINVPSGAFLPQQGTSSQPCGNVFTNLQEPLRNDGPAVTYWRYNSSQEQLSLSGNGGILQTSLTASPANACRNQAYTFGGVNGSRSTGTPLAFIQALMDSVARQDAPFARTKAYQQQIVDYFAGQNNLAALIAFLPRLEATNAEAHRTIGLYLLWAYRQQNDKLQAQLVRATLLRTAGQDAEVLNQIRFADVLASLQQRSVRPGQRLTVADSVALRQVAVSTTAKAEEAAIWLRYYYPHALPAATRPTAPLPATRQPLLDKTDASATRLDGAHPNPAATELTVRYALAPAVRQAELHVYSLLSGRRVLTQVLLAKAGSQQHTLDVRALPPGQYSYRLVTDGQPGPARHLVIVR